MVSRDIMIVAGVMVAWLLSKPVEIRPVWTSKFNTAAQIAFAATVLGMRAFNLHHELFLDAFSIVVVATTVISAVIYMAQWLNHMTR